jgi:hypothetical protein
LQQVEYASQIRVLRAYNETSSGWFTLANTYYACTSCTLVPGEVTDEIHLYRNHVKIYQLVMLKIMSSQPDHVLVMDIGYICLSTPAVHEFSEAPSSRQIACQGPKDRFTVVLKLSDGSNAGAQSKTSVNHTTTQGVQRLSLDLLMA